jgi:predicted permease
LRRFLPVSVWGILTIPVSVLFFILVTREIPESFWQLIEFEAPFAIFGIYFMLGMMIGLLQWLFLRQQAVHSSIWLLSSVLGAGLSVTLVIETDLINSSGVLAYMAAVLIYVVATGLTLAMLISGKHASQSTITHTD